MIDDLLKRNGPAVGAAIERRLLDKAGGADTIRKVYKNNANGSTTMLHTRGSQARPEVITDDPKDPEDLPEEWFFAVPASLPNRWGFHGPSDIPMTYPNEEHPGSALIGARGSNQTRVRKNKAWVTQHADANYVQHPGNSYWTNSLLRVRKRKIVSWWSPFGIVTDVDNVMGHSHHGLGDHVVYFVGGYQQDYSGTKSDLGQIFVDGVLTYTLNRHICAAAFHERGGITYLRYITPEISPDLTWYQPYHANAQCWERDPISGISTMVSDKGGLFSSHGQNHSWPEFNASGTKFLHDKAEYDFLTCAKTDHKVSLPNAGEVLDLVGLSGPSAGLMGAVITDEILPISVPGASLHSPFSEKTTEISRIENLWYKGDTVKIAYVFESLCASLITGYISYGLYEGEDSHGSPHTAFRDLIIDGFPQFRAGDEGLSMSYTHSYSQQGGDGWYSNMYYIVSLGRAVLRSLEVRTNGFGIVNESREVGNRRETEITNNTWANPAGVVLVQEASEAVTEVAHTFVDLNNPSFFYELYRGPYTGFVVGGIAATPDRSVVLVCTKSGDGSANKTFILSKKQNSGVVAKEISGKFPAAAYLAGPIFNRKK